MYRVLLSGSGVAYAKSCGEELDDADEFLEIVEDFMSSGNVILLCEDLDDLEYSLNKKYTIEVVGDE